MVPLAPPTFQASPLLSEYRQSLIVCKLHLFPRRMKALVTSRFQGRGVQPSPAALISVQGAAPTPKRARAITRPRAVHQHNPNALSYHGRPCERVGQDTIVLQGPAPCVRMRLSIWEAYKRGIQTGNHPFWGPSFRAACHHMHPLKQNVRGR